MAKAVMVLAAHATGYWTVKETAAHWGVTKRYVNLCIEAGRVQGAVKAGNMWLVPSGTAKPADKRSGKNPQQALAADVAYVNAFAFVPFPQENPEAVLASVPARVRPLPNICFAYLRGEFAEVKQLYHSTEGDSPLRLSAATLAASAAIGSGDYAFFAEIEAWLKAYAEAHADAGIGAIAECALTISYLGAHAPAMAPEWLKAGAIPSAQPPGVPERAYARVKYLQCMGQYETMLATAQSALAFCARGGQMSLITVYLTTACAVACCGLGRMDEGREYLLRAMRACLPHGFTTPFVELANHFSGMLEACLVREFPSQYDVVIGRWPDSFRNWMSFHDHFCKDNLMRMLPLRDYHIARMVAQGYSYHQIAEHLHIAPGTVKNRMDSVYEALLLSGRNRRQGLAKHFI